MGPSFLTAKVALAGVFVLGAGAAAATTVVMNHNANTAGVPPPSVSATAGPVATLPGGLRTLPPGVTFIATPSPTAPLPHVTLPIISHRPTAIPLSGPPVITSLTVSPDTWETWDSSTDVHCHNTQPVTPSSTTYAYIHMFINAPFGVASTSVDFSFTGNSGSADHLDLHSGTTNEYSTEIGGYDYKSYNIIDGDVITYTIHVTDTHGNTVSAVRSGHLHTCGGKP